MLYILPRRGSVWTQIQLSTLKTIFLSDVTMIKNIQKKKGGGVFLAVHKSISCIFISFEKKTIEYIGIIIQNNLEHILITSGFFPLDDIIVSHHKNHNQLIHLTLINKNITDLIMLRYFKFSSFYILHLTFFSSLHFKVLL